jgi:hemerythrin superfamily protein
MPNRMDSMVSKGMGTVKGMKARLGGLVGIFRTLAEQHGEVSALIERVRGDAAKRTELWPKIRVELISHERGEVRELYPALRNHPETQELANHHDEEARQLEQLIERLDATPIASEAWGALFGDLADVVLHHASEEETDIFPTAQKVLGKDRAKQMERAFLQAKAQVAESVQRQS